MTERRSTYGILGIPDGLAVAVVLILLGLTVAPFLPGIKLGTLEIPRLPDWWSVGLKIAAPLALLISIGAFFKIWASRQPDRAILEFFRTAFNRDAFKVSFANEAVKEDFIVAIDDTLRALNTGVLFDRVTRQVLQKCARGTSSLSNKELRQILEQVAELLASIRDVYSKAASGHKFRQFEHKGSFFRPEMDRETANRIDDLTVEALNQLNKALALGKMDPLPTKLERDSWRPR